MTFLTEYWKVKVNKENNGYIPLYLENKDILLSMF